MNCLGKNNIIAINNRIFKWNEFRQLVYIYKKDLEENELKKIDVVFVQDIHFISLVYAALLLGCHINIISKEAESADTYKNFLDETNKINLVNKDFKMKFYKEDSDIALSYNNDSISYEELKGIIRRVRKNYGKREVVYSDNLDKISSLCLGLIVPLYLEHFVIFNDDLHKAFIQHKPTVFIGEKRKIRRLYSMIFGFSNKDKMKEIIYSFLKDWDNSVTNIFLNKCMLFSKFKQLRIIVIEEKNDLNGLWLDFESLGIEIFSKKIVLEKVRTDKN